MDWTLDSIMDLQFRLEFQLPGVKGHLQLISNKVLNMVWLRLQSLVTVMVLDAI